MFRYVKSYRSICVWDLTILLGLHSVNTFRFCSTLIQSTLDSIEQPTMQNTNRINPETSLMPST